MLLLWKAWTFLEGHLKKDKSVSNNVESRKILDEKSTLAIATSNEEHMFICERQIQILQAKNAPR